MIGLVERIKKTSPAPDPDTDRRVKNADRKNKPPTPAAIPAPSLAGLGPEYNRIWDQAWELAEWIDNPAAAPIEERRAKLSELNQMRERMAAIARQAAPPAGSGSEPSPAGTWMPWKSTGATTRDRSPDTCPAKCKRSGKCYAAAYFEGKPGKAKKCEPDGCKHISNERGSHDSKTVGSF